MSKPLLVFDMDGVLVDVTQSYRATIARTAAHFIGAEVSLDRIQEYKNRGGFNDDWKLTHRIVAEAGVDVPFESVKEHFQRLFLGNGTDGLILRERWVARPGTLEKLNERFQFAIFTGRPRAEADLTLRRFAAGLRFDPIIATEDVRDQKPHPEGLLRIGEHNADRSVFYIGDTVDDARCACAAGVPFIGIAAPSNPLYLDLVFLFQAEKAYAIVDDINYLEEVFAS
ncbi:MAG: HAD-IA family hydrolase [Bryobacteraceae bacterium]